MHNAVNDHIGLDPNALRPSIIKLYGSAISDPLVKQRADSSSCKV
jgi:hypothetical protein